MLGLSSLSHSSFVGTHLYCTSRKYETKFSSISVTDIAENGTALLTSDEGILDGVDVLNKYVVGGVTNRISSLHNNAGHHTRDQSKDLQGFDAILLTSNGAHCADNDA